MEEVAAPCIRHSSRIAGANKSAASQFRRHRSAHPMQLAEAETEAAAGAVVLFQGHWAPRQDANVRRLRQFVAQVTNCNWHRA
jgi:hypothetical protein